MASKIRTKNSNAGAKSTAEDEIVDIEVKEETPEHPEEEVLSIEVLDTEDAQGSENDSEESPITFTQESNSTPPVHRVKVCLKQDHSCFIGGVLYQFEKGKTTTVPEDVKTILSRANLLKPL